MCTNSALPDQQDAPALSCTQCTNGMVSPTIALCDRTCVRESNFDTIIMPSMRIYRRLQGVRRDAGVYIYIVPAHVSMRGRLLLAMASRRPSCVSRANSRERARCLPHIVSSQVKPSITIVSDVAHMHTRRCTMPYGITHHACITSSTRNLLLSPNPQYFRPSAAAVAVTNVASVAAVPPWSP